jgi:hypothetical protein
MLRLHPPLLTALDSWIAEQKPRPTRPEAVRFALRSWLVSQGALTEGTTSPSGNKQAQPVRLRSWRRTR